MKSDCLSPEGQQLSVRRSQDTLPRAATGLSSLPAPGLGHIHAVNLRMQPRARPSLCLLCREGNPGWGGALGTWRTCDSPLQL